MMIQYKLLQAIFHNVRIDFRCRHICMPQERLNRAQIGASRQQMSGKSVSQRMRRHA